ncbi:Retrovirus-related Pol polyprotein from transposon TNT 1-94 [Salvia divinorum]|uniref:Retrovirus-related Pol polyprotein from transposon TNT 1-94 n=1 Tax=Salvia divinorum TaxID=28513 RepID=A0ABD1FWB8_SALDI
MSTAKFEVEKFSGRNDFGLWRLKMKAILMQQGLWDILNAGNASDEELDVIEEARRRDMQYKAYSTLILNLTDRVLREVSKEETAAGVWAKLESLYMTKSLANRLHLKQKLLTFKITEGKSLLEQLEEFGKCIDDLENIDEEIKDEDKALMLLNSLPKSYEHFNDVMLLGRESKISYEEVYSALKLRNSQKSTAKPLDPAAESLYLKNGGKGLKKKYQKGQEKSGQGPEGRKETRSCHYCGKPGHLKKACFAWKRKQEHERGGGAETADVIQEVEGPEALNVLAGAAIEEFWIMDSGCTFHICSHRSWFQNLEMSQGSVILGNDQTCEVKGIGDINLKVLDVSIKILMGVRYIPKIKRNLISLGLLESKGCSFNSESGVLKVMKNSRVILEARRKNSLYYLMAETLTGSVNSAQSSSLDFWHARLGHVGEKGIRQLEKQGAIEVRDSEGLKKCESCILGKAKKLSFPSGRHTSTGPFMYAHSDLWGPSQVESLSGGKYFMSIIDDYSRKVWVYILKDKSQAFIRFQEWHNRYENERGSVLKCLRIDNGMEFLSGEFEEFCKLKGIKRHRTAPRNPQQNGVAERMNRTLLERVRCMLFASGLPKKFWAEDISTAAALINKCPSSAISDETPDKRWYVSLGDYAALRTFGCAAYAHVKQNKLEPRARKCVMLGYPEGVKGYRLWCLEKGDQKIIITRDVTFAETEIPYSKGRPLLLIDLV